MSSPGGPTPAGAEGGGGRPAPTAADVPGLAPIAGGEEVKSSVWNLANYVYGVIATMVTIGGLQFDPHVEAGAAIAVILVGAIGIWLAHATSQLVARRAALGPLSFHDIDVELRGSWPIVTAAIPSALVMVLAWIGLFEVSTGLTVGLLLGILALAAVGVGTAQATHTTFWHQVFYVVAITAIGAAIVLLETLAHHL